MKKIILFIVTFILFVNVTNAEEYSEWQQQLDFSIKYKNIETETRYRFYKEEIEGEYLIKDTLDKYNYENKNKYIYSDFSLWQESCEVDNANIENKVVYPYKKLIVDTNYIHIYEFANNISFKDIKVFSNGKEIPYTYEVCDNCVSDYTKITKDEQIILKLDGSYPTKSLSFYIEANDGYPNIIYKIMTTYDIDGSKIGIAKVINSNLKDFVPDSRWYSLATESDIMYSDILVEEDDNTVIYPSKNMCRYQQKMTYHYNINKVYYDDNYYTNIDGYIKDINDYKIYYRYLIETDKNTNNDNNINKIDNNEIKQYQKNEEEPNKIEEDKNINKNSNVKNNTNNNTNKEVPIVNTMSINKQIPIIKYIILVVIVLTLIFIFYKNKKMSMK